MGRRSRRRMRRRNELGRRTVNAGPTTGVREWLRSRAAPPRRPWDPGVGSTRNQGSRALWALLHTRRRPKRPDGVSGRACASWPILKPPRGSACLGHPGRRRGRASRAADGPAALLELRPRLATPSKTLPGQLGGHPTGSCHRSPTACGERQTQPPGRLGIQYQQGRRQREIGSPSWPG